jgi:DNA polymerase-3 subunit gamma/tau
MENFVVSARKYRPASFDTVVGQRSLTTTLKNSIISGHLAHAYLFCGPRGVGKTTCARIFAKTINCENRTAEGESCNKCESCVSFNEQRSLNIYELDAASNNSVDDIRELIENVRIPPQIGRYRVFIIDEVHMLSSHAFNAFLKTLEEPPRHAIFILATTEKHKILATILSRCQIYDFNRITIQDTVEHLQNIAQKEGVTADVTALNVIARKADGGMRDALSIFDQMVSFCGNDITYQGTIDNLNVLDYEYYFKLTDSFITGNIAPALLIFDQILKKGFDAHHFITGLCSHFRDLLVSRDSATIVLLETAHDVAEKYVSQAKSCTPDFLFQAIKIANDCDLEYSESKNRRLLVELALIRICQLQEKKNDFLTDEKPKLQNLNTVIPETVTVLNQPKAEYQTAKPAPEVKKELPTPPPQFLRTATKPKPDDSQKSGQNEVLNSEKEQYSNSKFSETDLQLAWKEFGETLTDTAKSIKFPASKLPALLSETEFEIAVSNQLQEKDLLSLQNEIIRFLSDKLHNSNITMKINISESTPDIQQFSPEEKFKMMAKNNPNLAALQKNLELELD